MPAVLAAFQICSYHELLIFAYRMLISRCDRSLFEAVVSSFELVDSCLPKETIRLCYVGKAVSARKASGDMYR